jgi:hypothetical protein
MVPDPTLLQVPGNVTLLGGIACEQLKTVQPSTSRITLIGADPVWLR